VVQGLGRVTAALYFPGAQSVQTPAPAALYLPPGHWTGVGVVEPGGQANLWGCNGGGDIVLFVGLLPFSSLAFIETVVYSSQWKRLSAHIFCERQRETGARLYMDSAYATIPSCMCIVRTADVPGSAWPTALCCRQSR
jgi:hypothetical protein